MTSWFNILIFLVSFSLNFYFVFMFEQFFHQVQGISFLDCKHTCDKEDKCLSVRYLRRFALCKLYDIVLQKEVREPGTQVHVKTEKKSHVVCRENKDIECQRRICSVPRINGAYMSGNLFDVGSKVVFTCRETGKSQAIRCLSDGLWSMHTLFCTPLIYSACGYPGKFLHGQLGTLTAYNDSHVALNVSCNTGYTLHFTDNILCEISTGYWSGFENYCCELLNISGWTKIYSSPKTFSEPIIGLYRGKYDYINTCKTGFYRDENVFLNWENAGITSINFTVISDGAEVAYMLFNGTNSTTESWFSINNLLQSSWSDLQPSTQVQVFSFLGMEFDKRRWFVAQNASGDGMCTGDTGWFVVSWHYYDSCTHSFDNEKQILYSTNGRASRFVQDEIGVADRFEIWIQK